MKTLSYSANAYAANTLMRSRRTLLVEGVDDKKVLSRLLIELSQGKSPSTIDLVVDSAEMIKECPGVFSNREKVEYIHALVSNHDKLGAWVDREFRLFTVSGVINDELAGHNVPCTSLFWTRGHSVENYFFDATNILSYLEHYFPEHLPSGYRESIEAVVTLLTRYAASLSLAAKELGLVTRMNNMFNLGHWAIDAARNPTIKEDSLAAALSQRGVEQKQVTSFIERFRTLHEVSCCTETEPCRWVAHGHIGLSVIWSGVAATLAHCGMTDDALLGKISHGDWEHKYRLGAELWSRAIAGGVPTAPLELVKWIKKS